MEAMALDEMDQDHGQKSGREELEDTVQDQIRPKEDEISKLSEEMKERREEIKEQENSIRELEEEIRHLNEEIRGVENEIATGLGTGGREPPEVKLQFLRQEISSLREEIRNRDQQIIIFQQGIGSLRSMQKTPAPEGREKGLTMESVLPIYDIIHSKVDLMSAQQAQKLDLMCVEQAQKLDLMRVEQAQKLDLMRVEQAQRLDLMCVDLMCVEQAQRLDLMRVEQAQRLDLMRVEQAQKLNLLYELVLESFSQTRAASTINMDDLCVLRTYLGISPFPEEEEALNALLGPETEGGQSFRDDATYELQFKEEYTQQFKEMTKSRDVVWSHANGTPLRTRFSDVEFDVVAKNDLVLSLKRFQSLISSGAILGVEIKRKLSWRGLSQAEVDFYVWSTHSMFPFVQLITDMEQGGVAFYSKGGSDVTVRTLGSMEAVRDFVSGMAKSLPPDAGEDDSENGIINPETFLSPSRKRFRSRDLEMSSSFD